jgi:GDP-4-dehydro-6-deoxy-D-mannose reductase
MTRILITGIGGFVGSHLSDFLLQDHTTSIAGVVHPTHPVQHLEENPRVTIYSEDILKPRSLKKILKEVSPDEIYHLAGFSHVHESWKHRKETFETNFMGTLYLLEACRSLRIFPKVLLVGSAETYGIVPEQEQPIEEKRHLSPSSPYAVSKMAQEALGIQYARSEKLPVFLTRSFNHTGPRQKETFVCSAFARQIAFAELKEGPAEIRVGNLIAKRDFTDVRDVVRAYRTVLQAGIPGEPYNICSGSAISIEEILRILISFSHREFQIIPDRDKFRPVDMPLLLGSFQKLHTQTGWRPSFDLQDTLRDLLQYWREKLQVSAPLV